MRCSPFLLHIPTDRLDLLIWAHPPVACNDRLPHAQSLDADGLFALCSGAGLVALVGWSLLQSAEQARARAELDARSRANELAQALRAALRAPAVLELVPATERFTVADGRW